MFFKKNEKGKKVFKKIEKGKKVVKKIKKGKTVLKKLRKAKRFSSALFTCQKKTLQECKTAPMSQY